MRGAANLEARLERLASSGEARRPEDLLSRRIRIDRLDEGGNRRVLSVQGLATGYEGRLVFSGLGFDLFRGERLTLRGKNGSGKTTLFRVLLGEIPPAEGSFLIPPSVRVAYFAQKLEHLGTEASLLEAVLGGDLSLQTKARHILADFGLTGDSVFRKVSEGERRRKVQDRAGRGTVQPAGPLPPRRADEPSGARGLGSPGDGVPRVFGRDDLRLARQDVRRADRDEGIEYGGLLSSLTAAAGHEVPLLPGIPRFSQDRDDVTSLLRPGDRFVVYAENRLIGHEPPSSLRRPAGARENW